jgi:hypothetical protein
VALTIINDNSVSTIRRSIFLLSFIALINWNEHPFRLKIPSTAQGPSGTEIYLTSSIISLMCAGALVYLMIRLKVLLPINDHSILKETAGIMSQTKEKGELLSRNLSEVRALAASIERNISYEKLAETETNLNEILANIKEINKDLKDNLRLVGGELSTLHSRSSPNLLERSPFLPKERGEIRIASENAIRKLSDITSVFEGISKDLIKDTADTKESVRAHFHLDLKDTLQKAKELSETNSKFIALVDKIKVQKNETAKNASLAWSIENVIFSRIVPLATGSIGISSAVPVLINTEDHFLELGFRIKDIHTVLALTILIALVFTVFPLPRSASDLPTKDK